MNVNWKGLMNELGGAFAVMWLVFGITVWNDASDMTAGTSVVGLGLASLGGMLALAVAWMAFAGAHILPPVTWMHMITGDVSDVEGNWMANGMRLVAQIIGAALAIFLMAETTADYVEYAQAHAGGQDAYSFDIMTTLSLVAAGAVLGHINTNVDNSWAMPVAVMATAGIVNYASAGDMASMIMNETGDMMAVLIPWILDGATVGIGAFVAGMIADNLPE